MNAKSSYFLKEAIKGVALKGICHITGFSALGCPSQDLTQSEAEQRDGSG